MMFMEAMYGKTVLRQPSPYSQKNYRGFLDEIRQYNDLKARTCSFKDDDQKNDNDNDDSGDENMLLKIINGYFEYEQKIIMVEFKLLYGGWPLKYETLTDQLKKDQKIWTGLSNSRKLRLTKNIKNFNKKWKLGINGSTDWLNIKKEIQSYKHDFDNIEACKNYISGCLNNLNSIVNTFFKHEIQKARCHKDLQNTKEQIYRWLNLQDQILSKDLENELTGILSSENEFELLRVAETRLRDLYQLCQKIAKDLQGQEQIFYVEGDEPMNRGTHTVAAGRIPRFPKHLFLAFNYFNRSTNEPLTSYEKESLLNRVVQNYGNDLLTHGLKYIQIIERNDDGQKKNKKFYHDAHAEMILLAVECNASNPHFNEVIIGVGKGSCLKCLSCFYSKNVQCCVEINGVQVDGLHGHIHPNEIKYTRGMMRDIGDTVNVF